MMRAGGSAKVLFYEMHDQSHALVVSISFFLLFLCPPLEERPPISPTAHWTVRAAKGADMAEIGYDSLSQYNCSKFAAVRESTCIAKRET